MIALFRKGGLSIRGRLFLGFSILVVPLVIIMILFLIKINDIETYIKKRSEILIPILVLSSKMDAQIYETQALVYEWILTGRPEQKTKFAETWNVIKNTQSDMAELLGKSQNQHIMTHWKTLLPLYTKLLENQNKFIWTMPNTNNLSPKTDLYENTRPLINRMLGLLGGSEKSLEEGIFNLQEHELSEGADRIKEDTITLKIMMYVLLGITVFLSILVSLFTARKILGPIKSYSQHSAKVAAGDLTQRLAIETSDELGSLGNDLNTMTQGLAGITAQITEASLAMTTLLEEVKQAAEMQSTGISEQASSINEITASLEEIDKSATQTLEKAKILGQSSEETSEQGQKGLEAVQQSIAGMKLIESKVQTIANTILELSNQSQQIGEITTVVNTLALQSKMLALNASIEAAKAGEAGKGFAVVASEVKNLAEQSEQATTQVQKILEDIRHGTEQAVLVTEEGAKGVAEGTLVAVQMGEIMQSLTEAINETMLAAQQIEVAVRQESLGIEQITTGMNEINKVTASFVNTVKQTTSLITELNEMAARIKNYVEIYKV